MQKRSAKTIWSIVNRRSKQLYSTLPPTSTVGNATNPTTCKKNTINRLYKKFQNQEKLTMLTCYDACFARMIEQTPGIDMVLVGDSYGMVSLGYESTMPVTMQDMIHACRAVARGAPSAFRIGDMPFGSYEQGKEFAIQNAIQLVKEGHSDAVKLEGGKRIEPIVRGIIHQAHVPVMGHIGLTPQTLNALGGSYRTVGKNAKEAIALVDDFEALQDAGCFSIVLECVPDQVAKYIAKISKVPLIGIGSGPNCHGQVLVLHDVLGLYDRTSPKFAPTFTEKPLVPIIQQAFTNFSQQVKQGTFPNVNTHAQSMNEKEYQQFVQSFENKM